jgi:hypothetical protein
MIVTYQNLSPHSTAKSPSNWQKCLSCCRINFGTCFKMNREVPPPSIQELRISLIAKNSVEGKLSELCSSYMEELKSTIVDIWDILPLI